VSGAFTAATTAPATGVKVIKRYVPVWFPDTGHDDGRAEMHKFKLGRYLDVADLPVEALEKFRTPYHSAITQNLPASDAAWMARFFTFEQYNALRDLLLAITNGGNATTGE